MKLVFSSTQQHLDEDPTLITDLQVVAEKHDIEFSIVILDAPKPNVPEKIWKIVTLTNKRIAVVTPYNTIVIAEMNRLMGKWGAYTDKSGDYPKSISAWILDGVHLMHVDGFLADLFDQPMTEHIVTFRTSKEYAGGSEMLIDGEKVVNFERDSVKMLRHRLVLEVISNKLHSGGSARNPTMWGELVIRVRLRKNAIIDWGGEYYYSPDGTEKLPVVTIEDPAPKA